METYGDLYNKLKSKEIKEIELDDISTSKIIWIAMSNKELGIWDIKPTQEGFNIVSRSNN